MRKLLLLLLLPLMVGCLDTNFEEPNSEFAIFATLDENENFFEVGDDEIRVLSVRLKADNIILSKTGENEQFASNPTYANLNNFSFQNEVFMGAGDIIGGSYTGVQFQLIRPSVNSTIQDNELIVRNEEGNIIRRNSFVIQGIYNGLAFTITSEAEHDVSYSFDRNINMPETLGTLRVSLRAEWREWFLNNSRDALLDPNDSEDRQEIIENFLRLFTPVTFTLGEN